MRSSHLGPMPMMLVHTRSLVSKDGSVCDRNFWTCDEIAVGSCPAQQVQGEVQEHDTNASRTPARCLGHATQHNNKSLHSGDIVNLTFWHYLNGRIRLFLVLTNSAQVKVLPFGRGQPRVSFFAIFSYLRDYGFELAL
jgi:hypothetical protein